MTKSNLRTSLALVVGLTASSCATNPATGNRQIMLVSEAQEIEMGRQADVAVAQTIGLYADPVWQRYIQQFGARLAAVSERPNLPWTFRVVDDPSVNAFAVPGGFVYVTRGLLAHLTSEAELASVVGHEIGHVTARHTVAAMSKQQLIGLAPPTRRSGSCTSSSPATTKARPISSGCATCAAPTSIHARCPRCSACSTG